METKPNEQPKSLTDANLIGRLKLLVASEKKLTAEIVEHIREVDVRRLYLKFGCTSLFQYMTEHLEYTPASAQRRIDSARMLREIPELKADLQSGELNLMQVSTLARAVREREKTNTVTVEEKREILAAIKKQDVVSSEKTIAQMLDVPVKVKETKRIQKDESIRMEITLSKEQAALLNDVKSLISHTHVNPSFVEVFEYLAQKFVQKKAGKAYAGDLRSPPSTVEVKNSRYLTSHAKVFDSSQAGLLSVEPRRQTMWLKVSATV